MVDWSGVHSITVSMHEGMLLLAFIAVMVRFLVNLTPKLPVVGWFFSDEFLQKTARISETVAFIAGLGGTIGILASAATGTILSSMRGDILSNIVLNKIMVSVFAFVFWAEFIIIRLKFGDEKVWSNRTLQFFYPLTALIGFTLVTVGGSIGGTLAGKESIIEFIFNYLSVEKNALWILPPITEFSKIVVNSPLQYLVNISSMLQIIIILNILIVALVLVYVGIGAHSKTAS